MIIQSVQYIYQEAAERIKIYESKRKKLNKATEKKFQAYLTSQSRPVFAPFFPAGGVVWRMAYRGACWEISQANPLQGWRLQRNKELTCPAYFINFHQFLLD